MSSALAFVKWDNYVSGIDGRPLFAADPLIFSTRQQRLHSLCPGDRLWLVSRCPHNQQYYFVGVLHVAPLARNSPGSPVAEAYGEFALVADRHCSRDLGREFPAEGLLRAFEFGTSRPIKYGANIGQSIQSIRLLTPNDELVMDAALRLHDRRDVSVPDAPCALWTKCDPAYAQYFLANWEARGEPLAFLLYDSPPVLPKGAPVLVHSDRAVRLIATFLESQFVAGHKHTVEQPERLEERERIWAT